ncbi:hypothetical protein H5410_039205 [Solanum commersonii]|uniref:Uncharacterized protein n=1 Tax=Solanum commersonii TaxID=4109 RepID=A0A9J5YCY8_SOLCO|nr:hypothetical protein H5410_039205 [Solanum commersonii]
MDVPWGEREVAHSILQVLITNVVWFLVISMEDVEQAVGRSMEGNSLKLLPEEECYTTWFYLSVKIELLMEPFISVFSVFLNLCLC